MNPNQHKPAVERSRRSGSKKGEKAGGAGKPDDKEGGGGGEFEENTEAEQQRGEAVRYMSVDEAKAIADAGAQECYAIYTTQELGEEVLKAGFIEEGTLHDLHCCSHRWGATMTKFDGSPGKPWVCVKGLKCPVLNAPSWMCREFLLNWMCGQSHLNTRLDSEASCCPCAVHAVPIDIDLGNTTPSSNTKWLVALKRELAHEDMPGCEGSVNAWKKRKFKQKKSTQDRMGQQKEKKLIRQENDLYWEERALEMKKSIARMTLEVAKFERDSVKKIAEYEGQTKILRSGLAKIQGAAGIVGAQALADRKPTGNPLSDTADIMGKLMRGCKAWSDALGSPSRTKKRITKKGAKKKRN
jgi:hypothetical protein